MAYRYFIIFSGSCLIKYKFRHILHTLTWACVLDLALRVHLPMLSSEDKRVWFFCIENIRGIRILLLTFHHCRLRPWHLCSRWAPLAENKYQIRILNQYPQYSEHHDVNILNISTLVIGFALRWSSQRGKGQSRGWRWFHPVNIVRLEAVNESWT